MTWPDVTPIFFTTDVWFGLLWIRLFRPVRAIAESWDEGDGIEWTKCHVIWPGDLTWCDPDIFYNRCLVWFVVDKARSGHCRAMGWRRWDWVDQNCCRPGDLAVAVWDANPGAMPGRLPSHWRPPLPGGGSRTATYPVADSHQARVNEGQTEERGPVIQRINRDLQQM